jgi:glycosyltransferase involved in cell wall biosynthesis
MEDIAKKSIYFLHCTIPIIKPISGDQITEISIMKCLSVYYDVYYNNQLIDLNKPDFGLTNETIELPTRKYNYYWIRNNDKILLNCQGIKIRCGAPYTEDSYKKTDIIICYSKSWEKKLKNYNDKYIESGGLYPNSKIIIPKNIMTVYQTIDNRFYDRITDSEKIYFKNKMIGPNCDLLIGHFGRLSNTCYPKHLLPAFDILCKKYPNKNLKLLFCGKPSHFKVDIQTNNPNVIVDKKGINHEDIHKFIQSCDLITSDYNSPTADWGGCMHILESMACGVPVLCGNFDVRIEQLGKNYQFFWNKNDSNNLIIQQILTILENIVNKKIDIEYICKELVERSKKYTTNIIAKEIYNNLENIQLHS